jgi:hypothetical protein
MCNDFESRIAYRAYVEEFSRLKLPVVSPTADAAPNLEPRVWPTELARGPPGRGGANWCRQGGVTVP